MTFKETEFVGLFRTLKHYVNTIDDPELFRNIVKVLIKLYEQIPIYPGIVDLSLNNSLKQLSVDEITPGMAVSVTKDGKSVTGIVDKKEGKKVTLKNAYVTQKNETLELEVDSAYVIDFDILKHTWPTLVFEEE